MKRLLPALGAVVVLVTATAQAATTVVTLDVRPKILNIATAHGNAPLLVTGAVSSANAGEEVEVYASTCGMPFTLLGEVETISGGRWELPSSVIGTSVLEARWKGQRSKRVTVKARPRIELRPSKTNRFHVVTRAYEYFDGTTFFIERFDRGKGWVRVGKGTLRRAGAGGILAVSQGYARAAVKRGQTVRAVLPITRRGSCYVTGISLILRV